MLNTVDIVNECLQATVDLIVLLSVNGNEVSDKDFVVLYEQSHI